MLEIFNGGALGLCGTFLVLEVARQILTYGIKYNNNGVYPLDSSLLIVICEIVKLALCGAILVAQQGFRLEHFSAKFCVPAVFYVLQNNIYMTALNYTTPPTFTLLIQTRIIMTALVYKFILKRPVSQMKWLSLIGLTVGVVISQMSPDMSELKVSTIAVTLATTCSVFSVANSVYVEQLLKNHPSPFVEQQVQLYFWSIIASSLFWLGSLDTSSARLIATDSGPVASFLTTLYHSVTVFGTFDRTTTTLVCATIAVTSIGGLVVAAIMKRLDNLAKIFTAALAIMVTGLCTEALFPDKFTFTWFFMLGNVLVLISTVVYSRN
jgi:UDP-sugar transporter A1/2/3